MGPIFLCFGGAGVIKKKKSKEMRRALWGSTKFAYFGQRPVVSRIQTFWREFVGVYSCFVFLQLISGSFFFFFFFFFFFPKIPPPFFFVGGKRDRITTTEVLTDQKSVSKKSQEKTTIEFPVTPKNNIKVKEKQWRRGGV